MWKCDNICNDILNRSSIVFQIDHEAAQPVIDLLQNISESEHWRENRIEHRNVQFMNAAEDVDDEISDEDSVDEDSDDEIDGSQVTGLETMDVDEDDGDAITSNDAVEQESDVDLEGQEGSADGEYNAVLEEGEETDKKMEENSQLADCKDESLEESFDNNSTTAPRPLLLPGEKRSSDPRALKNRITRADGETVVMENGETGAVDWEQSLEPQEAEMIRNFVFLVKKSPSIMADFLSQAATFCNVEEEMENGLDFSHGPQFDLVLRKSRLRTVTLVTTDNPTRSA